MRISRSERGRGSRFAWLWRRRGGGGGLREPDKGPEVRKDGVLFVVRQPVLPALHGRTRPPIGDDFQQILIGSGRSLCGDQATWTRRKRQGLLSVAPPSDAVAVSAMSFVEHLTLLEQSGLRGSCQRRRDYAEEPADQGSDSG